MPTPSSLDDLRWEQAPDSVPRTLDELPWGDRPAPSPQKQTRTLEQLHGRHPLAGEGVHDLSPSLEGVRTALQYGLPGLATLFTVPFTGGMSTPMIYLTEGAASSGAEAFNQLTGISERDPLALAMSAVLPGVGRGTVEGGSALLKRFTPGFGKAAQAVMTPVIREFPNVLFGGEAAKQAYQNITERTLKAVVPRFPKLAETVSKLGAQLNDIPWKQLKKDFKGTSLGNLFEDIETTLYGKPAIIEKRTPRISGKAESLPTGLPKTNVTIQAVPPGMTVQQAKASTEAMGWLIGHTSDDKLRGKYKLLYSAMLDDLEAAPLPPGADLAEWTAARTLYKREKAANLLTEQIEKATTTTEGIDIARPDSIVKWLRTNTDYKQRVTPQEFEQTMQFFRNMAKKEGKERGRFIGILIGGAVGQGFGGALGGYVAAEMIAKAMMTDGGRKLAFRLLANPNASWARRGAAILGAAISGGIDYSSYKQNVAEQ